MRREVWVTRGANLDDPQTVFLVEDSRDVRHGRVEELHRKSRDETREYFKIAETPKKYLNRFKVSLITKYVELILKLPKPLPSTQGPKTTIDLDL